MDKTFWTSVQPLLAQGARDFLRTVGTALAAHGYITGGAGVEAFIGAGMTFAGLFWGWWTTSGYLQAGALLKKLTATHTAAAAVEVAKVMPAASQTGAADSAKAIVTASGVAKVLIAAFALSLFLPHASFAQGRQPLTGNIVRDIQTATAKQATSSIDSIATVLAKPFQDIADFIGADADGAVALSTAIPNLQDGHGQQCWIAMQSFGAIIKAHPIPITFHVINDYESLRLLGIATNNLCSNVHCTQVFADFTAMAQAASPMPLAIPSLHDLCTKVPQIAVVAPVTVTATAPPDATAK